jgi:hypothetical protein
MAVDMFSLLIDGVEHSLSDGSSAVVLAHSGLGMPPVRRLAERGAQQDGESDVGFKVDARTIELVLGFVQDDAAGWFDVRSTLLELFHPNRRLSLRVQVGSEVRQIDCYYRSDLVMSSAEAIGSWGQKAAVSLRCPEPSWYDPTERVHIIGMGGGGGAFVVPSPVPTAVGSSVANSTLAIEYPGTWNSFPVIRLVGPITDPVVTNLSTGDKLDFTGTTIATGDWYEIDTRYGYKTVIDSGGVYRNDKLTPDSDLATFHIAGQADFPGGNNTLTLSGTAITTDSSIQIRYFVRYIGV